MPTWVTWILLGLLVWTLLAILVVAIVGRAMRLLGDAAPDASQTAAARPAPPEAAAARSPVLPEYGRRRVLVVDDDPGLRMLLRTTLAADEFAIEEAASAEDAGEIARFWSPAVVILDIGLPGVDGLTFCRELKRRADPPRVVLLTGADTAEEDLTAAGADAVLHKPFSPLALAALLDDVGEPRGPHVREPVGAETEQLLMYARDLGRVLEVERTQRRALQYAYRQTVIALADALEAKDPATGLHAIRVQQYALELTPAVDPALFRDPSLEYGFLLHDVGKIGIPDTILHKPGPLNDAERLLMQRHTLLGADILAGVPLLAGAGLGIVRSHHERWDGLGYPHRLAGTEIPTGARIFALVDALDAMTSDRPYRRAMPWEQAVDEILAQAGTQFDPRVVAAFATREPRLRRVANDLAERAA